jgi:2-dehydro-3-deoxyphosphogluconate aldolase/(4S)-4-hydroxy-2-oxoglutarate aldolase
MTPTEIISAEHLGARFVKLFPGQLLGPAFVSAVKELFPRVAFMPTGGAEPVKANLEGWFKSGVAGVGMGSKLITPAVLAAKNYEELTLHTRHVLELIREIRN